MLRYSYYKTTLLLATFMLSFPALKAQVNNLPYQQDFSQTFILGNDDVEFIPNWYGNEVDINRRIFQTGGNELAMIPTSSFNPEVTVYLNLSNYEDVAISFKAKSVKNGDGNRSGLLYIETSTDGGYSWHTKEFINSFENANTAYATYKYVLAGAAGGRQGVYIKISVERSSGEGTSPQIVIDDVEINANNTDVTPPQIIDVTAQTANRIRVMFNDKMDRTALSNPANYAGIPSISKITLGQDNTIATLDLSQNLIDGKSYTLSVNNLSDKAGNPIKENTSWDLIYNESNPNIFITEIMYGSPVVGEDSLEFLEIYNHGNSTAELGGLYFDDGLEMIFPEYHLASKAYALIAKNARAANSFYGKDFMEWTAGALDNAGEKLTIKNSKGQIVTTVKYKNSWGGNGNGHSISYCSPGNQALNSDETSWSQSTIPLNKTLNGKPIFVSPAQGCGDIVPEIRFQDASNYVINQPATVQLKMILVNANNQSSSVSFELSSESDAVLNQDFTSNVNIPSTITFDKSATNKEVTINIPVIQNQTGIKTAIFTLTNPQNANVGGNRTYELVILNENAPISQVCINEIASSNNSMSGHLDEFGDADDWVELKNNSNQDIPLAGYYVSDNPNNPMKYQIPLAEIEKTTIPANGYLILWADRTTNQGANHLDFKLSASEGESFLLTMPDGNTRVDEVTFPPLEANVSYGRKEDCADEWIVFQKPTFNSDNSKGEPVTSVIQRENAPAIVLYPNPNNGSLLYISEPITYTLYNQSGQILKRDNHATRIDISSLLSGLYFIQTDQGLSAKFIVNH